MKTNRNSVHGLVMVAVLTLAVAAFGQTKKIEGFISAHEGDNLTVQKTDGSTVTVKVSGSTEIREKKMNPFRGAQKYSPEKLIRGLEVEVEGTSDSEAMMTAKKIRFTKDDLKTTLTVESRVTPVENRLGTAEGRVSTAEGRLTTGEDNARKMSGQISELDSMSAANQKSAKAAQETADTANTGVRFANDRINSLDDYEEVHTASIHFKAGSSELSSDAKTTLTDVATQAKTKKGFVIEVAGYASADGNAEFNKRLSSQRAQAVVQYLAEEHDIPLRRIITPLGYGTTHAVADNATREGRKENRRTEVKILVSKGMTTSAAKTSGGETSNQ